MPPAAAHRPTALLFGLTGVVFATWASRIPAVQGRLDLSVGTLGLVLLAVEAGAVAGLPLGGALVARWGVARVLPAAAVAFPAGLVGIAAAPDAGWLALAVASWTAANSVLDVALNARGLELEGRAARPGLSGLHARHSLGLLAGALIAVGAVGAGLPLAAHLGIVAAVAALFGACAARRPLPFAPAAAPAPATVAAPRARLDRPLLLLGLTAFAAFGLEAIASGWVAVHLATVHAAPAALAAFGYTAFVAALAAGRLVGDGLLARHGRTRLVAACGLVAAAGGALVVAAPTAATALAGWVVVGLAVAPLAPALFGAVPAVAGASVPTALAAVSTIGYLGGVAGPPVVGLAAGPLSLEAALTSLVVAALAVTALARPALGGPAAESHRNENGPAHPAPAVEAPEGPSHRFGAA
jgi:hypothetical protein